MFHHHNMAPWKTDETGRFIVHRSLGLGARGPAGSPYVVEDGETGKTRTAPNLRWVKSIIADDRDGRRFEPYYSARHVDPRWRAEGDIKEYPIKLSAHGDWQNIKLEETP